MLRLLFVSLLAGLWQSLEAAQYQNLRPDTRWPISLCYNTSSGKTCFTTFLANYNSRSVRQPFKEASDWCKVHDHSSSLIVIDSLESKGIVDRFLEREVLVNETIFIDARKLSTGESLKWSWVNGHPTIPNDITQNAAKTHDGACVELKPEQPVTFCFDGSWTLLRFICEYSDSKSVFSNRQNNKSYIVSERKESWYDARNECLRFGGDLASITDAKMIGNWSRLQENERYWIGLHRNKWIWSSTGAAITYTNWEGGYPDESSDKQCICINPLCRSGNNGTMCENDRKWWTCNCNNSYSIVCQRGDISRKTDSETKATEESTPTTTSTEAPNPSTKSTAALPLEPVIPNVTTYSETVTDKTYGGVSDETYLTQSMNQKPLNPNPFSAGQTTVLSPSSTELHIGIIIVIILTVVAIFVIVAVVFMIRKRKHNRQNQTSPMGNTKQSDVVTSEYATVVPARPAVTTPAGNTIYAEVDMTQRPMPSNNVIYASVQPNSETVDMSKSVVYADLDLQKKYQT